MVNENFRKDLERTIKNYPVRQQLPPGSGRRYEPEVGTGKHNARIHKESKYADTHKNLPFSFRKPPKPKGRSIYVKCNNCGHIASGTKATVGMICNECGKFSTVSEV